MISTPLLNAVRKDVMTAMNEVAQKHGLAVLPDSRISYDSNSFYFNKITFVEGSVEDKEKREFEANCIYYNLQKSDYLGKFSDGKEILELVGIVPSRSKYPIKMRNVDTDKVLLYTTGVFKTHLKVAE